MKTIQKLNYIPFTAVVVAVLMVGAGTGCDNKEKVLEVETPRGEVDVERDTETGELDVEVDRD